MFDVTVRDHVMVAHSLRGEVFGPAQKLHGATYVVDLTFFRPELDPDGIVVDIGLATKQLSSTLSVLNYANLDEIEEFQGLNTTTEVLAKWIFDAMAAAIVDGKLGPHASAIAKLRVTLGESPTAWAGYEGALA